MPLVVRVPWKAAAAGARTGVRAELVDLYRTLVDLAGLDAGLIQADVQGTSLAPLFDAPAAPPPALAAKAAFSQIGSCACKNYTHVLPSGTNWTGAECNVGRCFQTNVSNFDYMGYSMISHDGYRYTAWALMNATTERVDFGRGVAEELYDLTADAHDDFDLDAYATNVAGEPGNAARVAQYREQLQAAVMSWY